MSVINILLAESTADTMVKLRCVFASTKLMVSLEEF